MSDEDSDMCDDDQSIFVQVDKEDHTLGNVVRHVLWTHPHVLVANYSQGDNRDENQIVLHCQTRNVTSAQQALVESLHITKKMFSLVESSMDEAVKRFKEQQS